MFRTITALLVALAVAILIGAFQILGLTIEAIQNEILAAPNVTDELMARGGALMKVLIKPYTSATAATPLYAPIVALGVAGFIAGLISKSGVRMLFVSLITIGVIFVGYAVLSMGAQLQVDILTSLAENIAIDIGAAFGLLFIPGIIGAKLTAEEY
ncbi:hypothetical protein EU537_10925 [Candidatus Thorarchaeota archaeon]|nr:MAG: hypothetical protein EU537_10925 [Candidatus Thorarchaeota archaeon]